MALGKKVKTLFLEFTDAIAPADSGWDSAVDSHTFQDNVRVIGAQVGHRLAIGDAAVNADHEIEAGVEVSRHGVAGQDGALARCMMGATWSAAVVAGFGKSESAPFCFPDGQGIDFDDGEVIYLHALGNNVGTVTIYNYPWAIVYYVER